MTVEVWPEAKQLRLLTQHHSQPMYKDVYKLGGWEVLLPRLGPGRAVASHEILLNLKDQILQEEAIVLNAAGSPEFCCI